MAQLPCIGLYKPCINPPFGDCAMYFDYGVLTIDPNFQQDIQGIKIPQGTPNEQLKPMTFPNSDLVWTSWKSSWMAPGGF